jgi:hypothetical protein
VPPASSVSVATLWRKRFAMRFLMPANEGQAPKHSGASIAG